MNINELKPIFDGKRCVILGFGREGRVWLSLLNRLGCCAEIAVADMKPQEIQGVTGISVSYTHLTLPTKRIV